MNTVPLADQFNHLNEAVAGAHPNPGHGALIQALNAAMPKTELKLVFSRSGWHRPGGVVDAHGNRIADNLTEWLETETESDGDVLSLCARYEDAGLLVTRLCGITHYFTAKTGEHPCDFVQVEVDELREIADHELFDPANPPDTPEDIIDPIAPLKVDPTPLGSAYYRLRQANDIAEAHERMVADNYAESLLALRFIDEWQASSAVSRSMSSAFVLRLAHYQDRFGDRRLQATPLTTHVRALPPLPGGTERGVDLSHFLTAFDRAVGYSMAWYFHMVSGAHPTMEGVARGVFEDVSGAHDYFPAREVAGRKRWVEDPAVF